MGNTESPNETRTYSFYEFLVRGKISTGREGKPDGRVRKGGAVEKQLGQVRGWLGNDVTCTAIDPA